MDQGERAETRVENQPSSLERNLRRLVPFGFSGAALVVENGRVLHAAGYGFADWQARLPNGPETVFDVGSLSKQFTAAAVLLMAERDLLVLEDTIGEYVPDVPEDKRDITLHHLLTHTSGLPEFHAFSTDSVHGDFLVMDRREAEQAILESPLDFPPGEDWTYSNAGYTLLAAIVERAAGRPFEAILRDELFEPAGLARTGLYFQPLWDDAVAAHGYRGALDQGSPLDWTDTQELWGLIGGGGILSTVHDLERWHRALQTGSVLPRQTVDRLFTPHVAVREGLHYGYGWYIEDDGPDGRVIRHGGANDFGFAARWRWYEEEDRLIVLLINREPPGMDASLAADALERVLEAVARGEDLALPPEVPAPASSTDLERHAGRYRLEAGGEIVVRAAMGGLVVEPRGPVPTRHLAFPAASSSELEVIGRLDDQAEGVVDGIVRGDYEPLAGVMADPSRLPAYRDYIAGWWKELEEAGGGRDDVEVLGTTPSWWSLGDDRLATVIAARVGDRSAAFRLHWRDGRIAGLGGGAVQEPATTLFAPASSGDFVGYHLGIRQPVRLAFEDDEGGETHVLRLHTPGWTLVGSAVDDDG